MKKKQTGKPNGAYLRKVRCPICRAVIGKYDMRIGLTDAVFFCPKCRREHTYTIPPQKSY